MHGYAQKMPKYAFNMHEKLSKYAFIFFKP